ncbi:hypothetical protein FN846DRAFT_912006 [Sphaerosporella brunnea]|uniref:Uncharacterized protein n=1 Tax=Sphaerosporella brunnea TaxID=1250544 RepID=A0A5J5EIG9_9PEZI|nr:hypothetical protein FN846DRAFT_912006 [Sphaerosporella brunnea]
MTNPTLVTDEAHASIQERLSGLRENLQITKFTVTCNLAHTKKGEQELQVDKRQVVPPWGHPKPQPFMGASM